MNSINSCVLASSCNVVNYRSNPDKGGIINHKLQNNSVQKALTKVMTPVKEGNEYVSPAWVEFTRWDNYTQTQKNKFDLEVEIEPSSFTSSTTPEDRSYGFGGSTFKNEAKIMNFLAEKIMCLNMNYYTVIETSWSKEEAWMDGSEEVSETYHFTNYYIVDNHMATCPFFREYGTLMFYIDGKDEMVYVFNKDISEALYEFSFEAITQFFEEESKVVYISVRHSITFLDKLYDGWATSSVIKLVLEDCPWLESFKKGESIGEFVINYSYTEKEGSIKHVTELEEVTDNLYERHWDMDVKFNCKKKSMKDLLRFLQNTFIAR